MKKQQSFTDLEYSMRKQKTKRDENLETMDAITPWDEMRIENAKQLLRDTTLTVSEAASSVGYESTEHFLRTFRKVVGCTPSEYRRRNS